MNLAQTLWRALAVWALIIFGESVLGTLRVLLLEPELGPDLSRQIAFPVSLAWIFAAAYFMARWIGARETPHLLAVGLLWAAATFCFDTVLMAQVMGIGWQDALADYNIARGRLMGLGLILMALTPVVAARLRGL